MNCISNWAPNAIVWAATLAWLGCGSGTSEVINIEGAPPAIIGDDAHHHHEDLGPNGGHLIDLEPKDYSVEWTHDDAASLVTVFILDKDHEEEVAIPVESVTIHVEIDKEETTSYTLNATNTSTDDSPVASRFQLKSGPLLTSLTLGEGVHAHLEFTVDDKTYQGEIEHHAHHGHHHH